MIGDLNNYYMNMALKEAQHAFEQDEVPIGAVIILVVWRRASFNAIQHHTNQVLVPELLPGFARDIGWRRVGTHHHHNSITIIRQ